MNQTNDRQTSPLATEKISKLLAKFAVPSIIAMLVSALYNIVDQIFIGQGVGVLGNAATNVTMPLTVIATAVALLLGIGGASGFNLMMGAGRKDEAAKYAGTAVFSMTVFSLALMVLIGVFLEPMLAAFGATENSMGYALEYGRIINLGLPFLIISNGCSHLIRGDGSPKYSMFNVLVGAVINTILDPLFIFVFKWGVAGAAWATIIGQAASCLMTVLYLRKFRTVSLTRNLLRLDPKIFRSIATLGSASFLNQLAIMAVQITMNNTLRYYGEQSVYGSDIPIAAAGIIIKINMIFLSVVLGLCQGSQPIVGYNYGAKNYKRVREAFGTALVCAIVISVLGFIVFQLFPRQIIALFGEGSEPYFQFAERYFRIFLFMTFINCVQPIASTFFTSIGKGFKGVFLSMTRQVIFLIPLILVLPRFLGIDGVMYAGPVADSAAALLAGFLLIHEMRGLREIERLTHGGNAKAAEA